MRESKEGILMTFAERFKIIHRVINGEITAEEALKLMQIAERQTLRLEG